MKKILIILLILAVAGSVFYFLFGRKTSEPASPEATPPSPVSTESAEETILIQNFSFIPSQIKVKVGTIVTWKNEDNAPHSIVSDPAGEEFESAVFASGEKYFFKFQKVGSYNYHCGIHPSMKGEIIAEQ